VNRKEVIEMAGKRKAATPRRVPLDHVIRIRVTSDERASLIQAAVRKGQTVSGLCRHWLRQMIGKAGRAA